MNSTSISARPDIAVATTAPRVTPTPARGVFKQVLADSLVRGAETAMRVLPGSPLMALAVRGAAGPGAPSAIGLPLTSPGAPVRGGSSAEGPTGGSLGHGGNPVSSAQLSPLGPTFGAAGGTAAAGPGAGQAGAPGGIESSIQQSQEMNLYYLQVQEAVNSQNR